MEPKERSPGKQTQEEDNSLGRARSKSLPAGIPATSAATMQAFSATVAPWRSASAWYASMRLHVDIESQSADKPHAAFGSFSQKSSAWISMAVIVKAAPLRNARTHAWYASILKAHEEQNIALPKMYGVAAHARISRWQCATL